MEELQRLRKEYNLQTQVLSEIWNRDDYHDRFDEFEASIKYHIEKMNEIGEKIKQI